MRKYLIVVWLIVLGLTGSVFAAGEHSIDLADYLALVSEGNLNLGIAQAQFRQSQLQFDQAKAVNLATGSKQAEKKAASDFAQAKAAYEQSRSIVMQQAVSTYFEAILTKMDVDIRQRRLKLAEERQQITDKKVAQGIAGNLELLQATAEVQRAKLDMQRAEQALEEKLLAFRVLASTTEPYIPGQPPIYPFVSYDPDEAVSSALDSSNQLKRLGEVVELARMELAKIKAEGAAPLTRQLAEGELTLAELNLRLKEQEIRTKVLSDLHTLRSLEKDIALSQLNMEIAQEKYDTAERQYAAGLLTGRELDMAVTDLWDSRKVELKARQNYALHLLSVKGLVGEELE